MNTSLTTLVEEMPLAHVVDSKFVDKVCAHCMISMWERDTQEKLSRCGRCKFTHYCNMKCQKKDWLTHKSECSYLSRVAPRIPESMPRLIGRIIMKLRRCGDKSPAFNGRVFASLKSHTVDIEKDEEKRNGFIAIIHVIKDYLPFDKMPSNTEIFDIFCKILINALVITDSCLNRIGLAVYLGLSALDHSCKPDAFIIFSGAKAILRSLNENITEYNDNLHIPYCDLLDLRSARCEALQKQHNFVCNCDICQDFDLDRQKSSVRCTKCTDGFCPYSPDDDHTVKRCKVCHEISVFNSDHVQKLYQQLTAPRPAEKNLNELIDLYHELEEVFSPYNVPLCKLAESIMISALNNEKYDEAVEYAEKTLLCYRTYYPKGHPSPSVRMFEYAKLLMLQHNRESLPVLRKALKMICESYGSESSFAFNAATLLSDLEKCVSTASS
ncbi:MYND finger family protein [Loa loa]|uniref:MYND finger family protein n=1 Tax=Loa loa TaxID=7209 RepID=A0A1S0U1K9_LOALO|nr:MYND finger family protein [Loa loa]EFO23026.1 MYND finger family protein [Loa loa]